jgi:hypothetical protein
MIGHIFIPFPFPVFVAVVAAACSVFGEGANIDWFQPNIALEFRLSA